MHYPQSLHYPSQSLAICRHTTAAQAHNHYQVSKVSGDTATHTRIRRLEGTQRPEELARMLGGVEITEQTLVHAKEMLKLATAER